MTEHEIQNDIRVALSKYGIVFRMNAGDFWQGKLCWSHEFSSRVLTDPTRVEGLPAGFSDLLFVGNGMIAFIEVKTPKGRVSSKQEAFLKRMREMGHRAGVARSVEDAKEIIKNGI